MSTQELLAGAPVWIRQCFARRNHWRDASIARAACRAWIKDLRLARALAAIGSQETLANEPIQPEATP